MCPWRGGGQKIPKISPCGYLMDGPSYSFLRLILVLWNKVVCVYCKIRATINPFFVWLYGVFSKKSLLFLFQPSPFGSNITLSAVGPFINYVDRILIFEDFDPPSPLCRQVYYISLCSTIDIRQTPLPLACLRSLWTAPVMV